MIAVWHTPKLDPVKGRELSGAVSSILISRLRIALVLPVLLSVGCVERTIFVRSDPPGAECTIDGRIVGTTPCELKFNWYGDREISLSRPGFKSVKALEPVRAPWYQVFPIDFFTDLIIPWTIHDRREFSYVLQPEGQVDVQDVQKRAEEMKQRLNKRD